ncbi:MAG: hypothetical protein JO367_09960 [Actinobacteria bacterium]|nr:hypothetical protein [Actinomycetota bacterium]
MSRRIEIELTSARDDGTWTWRAAGAKQPKGVLDAGILYAGAKVGDVVRADAEFELDGITVTAVLAPKEKKEGSDRLTVLGPDRKDPPPITSSLVAKRPGSGPRRDRDRDRDRDRPPRDRDRGPRPPRDREGGAPRDGERPGRPRGERPARGDGPRGERPARGDGPRRERPPRPDRGASDAPPKPKPKRLSPGSNHRRAVLDSLPPEQRAVAEQLVRGGMPALRQSIATQNEQAKAEGQPQITAEPLLAMGEELLPRLKTAEWMDRAEAAAAIVDEIGLRDLRSVVASAEPAARDDASRLLASTLRDALTRRVKADEEAWVAEIGGALDDNRVVRALRVSTRGPEPGSRLPAELASRLADAASAAMSPETVADRWVTLIDAVSASPVRRSVKPVGLPADAPASLTDAAKAAAGQIPALASLLGLPMPPPPGAARKPPPKPGAKPTPPPPPPPADAADAADTADAAEEVAH